jgi:hypothetical protein
MKKHLRGKRYIRSRASVKIGRMNHQIHKIERGVIALKYMIARMNNINWGNVGKMIAMGMNDALEQINQLPASVAQAIESARKTLDEMNVPQEGRIVQWKE